MYKRQPASLDALCKRFGVNTKARDKHGALIDAELLAQVYLELIGGKQPTLSFGSSASVEESSEKRERQKKSYPPRSYAPSPEERVLHEELLRKIMTS